jgi:SAM-dependent methyltransferase
MHSKRIKEKVKQDYDAIAEEFSDTRQFPWADFDLFKPYYKGGKILDLGCGNGRLLKFLKKVGYTDYTGIDQSEALLKQAKKAFPYEKFVLADMSDALPVRGKFDAIFLIASFHHLPPSVQLRALKQWRKFLKTGGMIFMTNWNLHQRKYLPAFLLSLLGGTYGRRGVLVSWRKKLQRYYYAFTKKRLRTLLEAAGYAVLFNDYTRDGKSASLWRGKNILTIARNENI